MTVILAKCPACHAKLPTPNPGACACGFDIGEAIAWVEPYTKPNSGALVLPIGIMRRLPKAERGELARTIERARKGTTPTE